MPDGTRQAASVASFIFHRALFDIVERHQPWFTFFRASDDPAASTISRIDGWHSTLDELPQRRTRALSGVIGGFHLPTPTTCCSPPPYTHHGHRPPTDAATSDGPDAPPASCSRSRSSLVPPRSSPAAPQP